MIIIIIIIVDKNRNGKLDMSEAIAAFEVIKNFVAKAQAAGQQSAI